MNHNNEGEAKRAVCCACHQQCGLVVTVRDNRVLSIRGDKEHPFSRGFACVKGTHAHEFHEHPQRLHRPLKRKGPRGSGRWQEIGWDEAMDEIANSIKTLTDVHGAEALAYSYGTFHGADYGIGQRFMNLFGSPNSAGQDKICYGPGALGETLTYGYGPSFFTFPIPGKTRCMVIWGFRPSASMPLMWRQVLEAKRSGAKLIVIDPEKIREVRQADLWLQCRPGTDAALALGLMHILVNDPAYDRAGMRAKAIGFDELCAHLATYTPAHVEELTGVAAQSIIDTAEMLAGNAPAIIHAGNGLCQSGSGSVQTGRALACLVAVSGNLGIEGGHQLSGPPRDLVANGSAFASDKLDPAQRNKRLGAAHFRFLAEGFNEVDAAMHAAWHGRRHIMSWLDSAHEPTLWRAIIDQDPYPVKALILQHHNPVGASANATLIDQALRHANLDLLVSQDLFLNASSSLADYVLPASHWLEKSHLSMGLGLIGFGGDFVECKPAALTPTQEHHSDYELWRDLGQRLGQAEHWPQQVEGFWDSCLAPAGLDFATASTRTGPLFGQDARATSAEEPVAGGLYGTPSGKIELHSSLLERWGEDPLPTYRKPPVVSANAAAFPLLLITGGRRIEGLHQEAQQMPWFRRKYPEPRVSMHPATAATAGIAAGDWIWIETPLGRVRQCALLSANLQPGVLHADRWWYPERGDDEQDPFGWRASNINVCTDDRPESCDSILGTWMLRGMPCRLDKEIQDTATASQ